jgi:hypothetical protein
MADTESFTPSGFLTAREALAIAAYGDPSALEGLAPGEPDMRARWSYADGPWNWGRRTPLLMRLRWVWARVRWRLTRDRRHGKWRPCPLQPLRADLRAQVRHLLRKHRKALPELIEDLAGDIERARTAATERHARLREADRALCSAVADGTLEVFGRRGSAAGGKLTRLEHEAVPHAFFFNRHRTLNQYWGWAALGEKASAEEWALWRSEDAPDWGDLRFPRAAMLARFPIRSVAVEPTTLGTTEPTDPQPDEVGEPSPPAPVLAELPAWWTLDQATAWIALRDTVAVRDAGPPRHGRDAQGVVGWHIDWICRKSEDQEVGPAPSTADNLMVDAARRGMIQSRGRPHISQDHRLIDPADWALVTIDQDPRDRGAKCLSAIGAEGLHWRAVVVAREDIVREWPPFDGDRLVKHGNEPTQAKPDATPTAAPFSDLTLLRPEYMLRVERWRAARRKIPNLRPPSMADDEAWAERLFGYLPRPKLRSVRAELSPPEWRKSGKRSGPIWRE